MYDQKALKMSMFEKGFDNKRLAAQMGINQNTMGQKIKSGKFTIGEANQIRLVLGLSAQQATAIFFGSQTP